MWKRLLGGGLLLRAIARELAGIHQQLRRQGDLLEKVLMVYAPKALASTTPVAPEELQDTGISYLDQVEAGLVGEYVARTQKDTGRPPTEDEILVYLADEKTVDLHQRLREREQLADLERLGRKG